MIKLDLSQLTGGNSNNNGKRFGMDDDILNIHVHTNEPGLAIQKALTYGSLTRMKIDNMSEEHQERVIKNAEREAIKQAEEDRKEREQEDKSKF